VFPLDLSSNSAGLSCPARGKECRSCGKLNHFAHCCRLSGLGKSVPLQQKVACISMVNSDDIGVSEALNMTIGPGQNV
jgi:hypothetical protein